MDHIHAIAEFKLHQVHKEDRTFEGILSTSHLDLGNGFARDVAMPKSFKRTIRAFHAAKQDGYLPLLNNHGQQFQGIWDVLGHVVDAREEELPKAAQELVLHGGKKLAVPGMGLWIKAQIIDGVDGDRLMDRMRPGSVRNMSMGYVPIRSKDITLEDGQAVRLLEEIKLVEASLVVWGMNPHARTLQETVKSWAGRDLTPEQLKRAEELGALLDGKEDEPPAPAPEALEREATLRGLTLQSLGHRPHLQPTPEAQEGSTDE